MFPKHIALDNPRVGGFANIGGARGKNGIAVICPPVLCEKADESLGFPLVWTRNGMVA
jgi:hypothetical protein